VITSFDYRIQYSYQDYVFVCFCVCLSVCLPMRRSSGWISIETWHSGLALLTTNPRRLRASCWVCTALRTFVVTVSVMQVEITSSKLNTTAANNNDIRCFNMSDKAMRTRLKRHNLTSTVRTGFTEFIIRFDTIR